MSIKNVYQMFCMLVGFENTADLDMMSTYGAKHFSHKISNIPSMHCFVAGKQI